MRLDGLAEAGVDAAASGVGRGGAGGRACRPRCRRAPGPRDLQAQGLGQPVAPVVPPAGAEPCPEAPPIAAKPLERRVSGHGPDCGGSP